MSRLTVGVGFLIAAGVSVATGTARAESTAAADTPAAIASSPNSERREAHVVFESTEPLVIYRSSYSSAFSGFGYGAGYSVSMAGERRNFERICVVPCTTTLPAGTDGYAVSRLTPVESQPLQLGAVTLPKGDSRVRLTYHDRKALRVLGVGVGAASLAAMVYGLVVAAGMRGCHDDNACEHAVMTRFLVAEGASLVGTIGCGILLGVHDSVDASVAPRRSAFAPRGLTLRVKY